MNLALWIVQGLLAAVFVAAGGFKAFQYDKAREKMGWVQQVPRSMVTLLGLAELLGGIGLVVPWATGIMPILTPLAAALLTLIMLGAIGTHIKLKEAPQAVAPLILGALSAFVAYGRYYGYNRV